MTGVAALLALALVATTAPAARAHHVGAYTPRDNEVTANFKQVKFSVQARKFDVARRVFETGALRREIRAGGTRLPAGLEAGLAGALQREDGPEVERLLMVFFAALARDLAREGERQVAAPASAAARRATAGRFLDALWRYYNLVDFAVAQRDNKASVAMRLAVDEAESLVREPPPAPAGGVPTAPDPERVRPVLRRIAEILSSVIETSSPRRDS